MIEFTTITIICILLLLYFRPGKTPLLNNSLVIERAGQYHVTLDKQLNLAQPFIEAIAKQLGAVMDASNNSTTLYFEVHDPQVKARGTSGYLLAITQRNGMLYFQATRPSPKTSPKNPDSDLQLISDFGNAVLVHFLSAGAYNPAADGRILKSIQEVAELRGVHIKSLAA